MINPYKFPQNWIKAYAGYLSGKKRKYRLISCVKINATMEIRKMGNRMYPFTKSAIYLY